jgi:hypothetical protein
LGQLGKDVTHILVLGFRYSIPLGPSTSINVTFFWYIYAHQYADEDQIWAYVIQTPNDSYLLKGQFPVEQDAPDSLKGPKKEEAESINSTMNMPFLRNRARVVALYEIRPCRGANCGEICAYTSQMSMLNFPDMQENPRHPGWPDQTDESHKQVDFVRATATVRD